MFFCCFCPCGPYCCCFSLYRGEGIILRFFPSIIIQLGLFRRVSDALLNTSAFLCRLLDIVKNTMFLIIFVFISKNKIIIIAYQTGN